MDFLNGKIKPLYLKYLAAAFGSALITSIYSIVDMAMVGQYQGPEGTAALAVVAPIWNVIYSLGLLMGIGGSVLFSHLKGKSNHEDNENEYFTVAFIGSILLGILAWLILIFFERQLLTAFGAEGSLLPLAQRYLIPIKFIFPCFLFNQMLTAFLRNDQNPGLATAAVLIGGIFNVFGDYFFVFVMDMGIFGAGLATALGSIITLVFLLTHFVSKKNTLALVKPTMGLKRFKEICVMGFSTFFIDVAMGFLTILFNRQIVHYLGTDALAVYGIIVNLSTFVQCCAYSVGQAAQPLISVNFGAKKISRINQTLRYALWTVLFFSLFWTILGVSMPMMFVYIFMTPTKSIVQIAPTIIRCYSVSFLLLPLNIFSAYYFQAVMEPRIALIISIMRGMMISGILILLLPILFGAFMIWWAMPITELLVSLFVVFMMKHSSRHLSYLAN